MRYHNQRKTIGTWWVRVLLALVTCHLSPVTSTAQSVEAKISSLEMLVGEQVIVTVTAHAKEKSKVEFPQKLLLPTDIEVLEAAEEPAAKEGNGMMRHQCNYVLTCFRDTIYPIPPINVLIDDKEYATKQLALQVMTVDVDTTNYDKYYGPKDVQGLAMSWDEDEWYKPFWCAWGVVILLLLLLFLLSLLHNNKPIKIIIRIIKLVPPHQKAMKAIEAIKAEHISSSEDSKEYYTRLTDALRQYINERYGFNATEMTSSEIIDRLTKTGDQKSLDELRQLFATADLVKFAKYSTMINENDANLVNAVDFINETKQENMPTEEVVRQQLTEEEKMSQKTRLILIVLTSITALSAAALFAYIGWFIYDLFLY